MTQRQIIDALHTKVAGLETDLRISEMRVRILSRNLYAAHKDAAKERKKLKREIDLLRNSP